MKVSFNFSSNFLTGQLSNEKSDAPGLQCNNDTNNDDDNAKS